MPKVQKKEVAKPIHKTNLLVSPLNRMPSRPIKIIMSEVPITGTKE